MKIRTVDLSIIAVACLLLSGCLTSPNAFYTDGDVFQDDRVLGDYTEENAEEGSNIRKDIDQPGRYLLRCFKKRNPERWMDLTLTLFRAGTNSYADFLPYDDSCIDRVAGAPPAGMDIIRNATHQPLHVVARIAIADDGVAFSLPQKRAMWEMVQHHPAFTNYIRDESLVLPQSSKELRTLLEKEGGTLFPKPTDFKKPKPLPK